MRRLALLLAVALTLAPGPAATAQNTPTTRLSLKGLPGVGLRVEPINREARADGLSGQTIQAAVEARLHEAGIRVLSAAEQRETPRRPCLQVSVATTKLAAGEHVYSIRVELTQWVASLANPRVSVAAAVPLPARTWCPANVFGIAPQEEIRSTALRAVGTMVEEFVEAYHQANPEQPIPAEPTRD